MELIDAIPTGNSAPAPRRFDRRTRAARLLKIIRRDLTDSLGRAPDALDTEMIEIAASAALGLRLLQAKLICGEALSPDETDRCTRLASLLEAALRCLGLDRTPSIARLSIGHGNA